MVAVLGRDLSGSFNVPNITVGTVDPSTSFDAAHGYSPGDMVINTSSGVVWICRSNTNGSAVWAPLRPDSAAAITGGTIDGVTIGGVTPGNGTFAALKATGFTSVSAADAISAAGTSSQSAATPLTKDFNRITTVAANAGVALPAALAGRRLVVVNAGANTLKIWPINGGTDLIDALSANTNTTLSVANRIASFYCFADGAWVSALGGAVSA
jgi:hypothetical protein